MSSEDISKADKLLEELESNSETYRSIFEAFPDFIGIIDSKGRILRANKSFLQATGLREEEIVGVNALSFVHPEDAEKAHEIFKMASKSDKIVRREIRALIGGKEYYLEVYGRFIYYGGLKFGIFVAKDITEKVKLEKAIMEREEFYRNVLDCSISGFLILEKDRILFANRTVEKITGYSVEELLGKSVEILFEERLVESVRGTIERILSGESVDLVTRFLSKGRAVRYARVVASLIDKKSDLILVSFEDITEKREYEKKLEEREQLYRTLVESSHTGIFIIQNNKIIYANNVVSKILGYSAEEIRKLSHPYDVISPEYREIAKKRYWAREKGLKVPESYEIKVQTKYGEEKWLRVLAKRIKYKGKPAVMVNIADITKLKEDEERLKKMNELLRIAGEIKGMLIHENSEFRILKNIKLSLEKLNAEVAVFLYESEFLPFSLPSKFIDLEILSDKREIKETVQEFKHGEWFTFIPAFIDGLRALIVLARREKFTEEELGVLSTISHDLSMRLKAMRLEKEKEIARRMIVENIGQFEELADKLRNPLAVIKGYIEIRKEFSEEEFISRLSEHVDKIERILDELRAREIATYEMKKILEGEV